MDRFGLLVDNRHIPSLDHSHLDLKRRIHTDIRGSGIEKLDISRNEVTGESLQTEHDRSPFWRGHPVADGITASIYKFGTGEEMELFALTGVKRGRSQQNLVAGFHLHEA